MEENRTKTDCAVSVVTPENIAFQYLLAGPFQRLPAFLFDFGVRIIVFFTAMVVLSFSVASLSLPASLIFAIGFLLFFALSWFYGIFFETQFDGRTPGKMLFGLRTIATDGRPINGMQAALRNFLRMADMAVFVSLQALDADAPPAYVIPTCSVGLVAMAVSPRLQRIGDLAAGTMVIVEGKRQGLKKMIPDDARAFGLAELIPPTFSVSQALAQTVGMYMERRYQIGPARRAEIANHLTNILIRRFGLPPNTSADLMMCALYVRIYLSTEQQHEGRMRLRRNKREQNRSLEVSSLPLSFVGRQDTVQASVVPEQAVESSQRGVPRDPLHAPTEPPHPASDMPTQSNDSRGERENE